MTAPVAIILIVALLGVVVGASFFFVSRKRGRGPELEPPASDTALSPPRAEEDTATEEPTAVDGPDADVLAPPAPERPSFRDRLARARATFAGFLGRSRIDEETWDELEEALIRADLGVGPATALIEDLRTRVKEEGLETGAELVEALKVEMKARLQVADRSLHLDEGRTNVWLFVGVNGVGKTTTIGKVGKRQGDDGKRIVMAAGDTFRAAAAE